MRFALYLGCTVPVRALNYELAARRTAERLGIEFVDLEGFSCCGYPARSLSWEAALLMTANNLALSEEQGIDICTLCSACTSTLLEANRQLQENEALRARINDQLATTTGRQYKGTVAVRHYTSVLYEEFGPRRLRELVGSAVSSGAAPDISSFGFAAHYGCHYVRPPHLHNWREDPENPHTLGELIEATGARLVPYEDEGGCCGGGILAIDQDMALSIARRKLDHVSAAGADGMVLICPFCDIMYETNQRSIERRFGVSYQLPVLYYPQLLGFALGFAPAELGFRLNRVKGKKTKELFKE